MTDWINDREKAYQAGLTEQRRRDELTRHRDSVLKAQAGPFLDALTTQVEQDVAAFHAQVEDPQRRVEFVAQPAGGFKLHRSHYPVIMLECVLAHNEPILVVESSFTRSEGSGATTKTERYQLRTDVNDDLVATHVGRQQMSIADLSRALIEPVLYPS